MNVFVVNLARRPDRRARMERILPPSWSVEYTTHWPGPRDGAAIRPADLGGSASSTGRSNPATGGGTGR